MPPDTETDILLALGRIEGKLDNQTNNQTKITYALIGLIAANLGVQFTPHSPIDWAAGITFATRFLSFFVLTFTAIQIWKNRDQKYRSKYYYLLAIGFVALAAMLLVGICHIPTSILIWFTPFRFIYLYCFFCYAWNIERINGAATE